MSDDMTDYPDRCRFCGNGAAMEPPAVKVLSMTKADAATFAKQWRDEEHPAILLPRHKCSLFLEHNPHNLYCATVAQYLEDLGDLDWGNDEAKARAIETNELWTLQWYPDTPVGFHQVAAPTLNEVLALAKGW